MDVVPRTIHPEYCASDADVLVCSSDDVVFSLHSANLKTHTLAFPFDHMADSKTLPVLFKFIYPEAPLPGLAHVSFELLRQVAYASHKYQIAAAWRFATFEWRRIDRLAIHTISQSPSRILQEMPLDGFGKWVLYREKGVLDLWPWRAKTGVAFPTAPVAMYTALESRLRDLAASSVRAFDPRV
ncbi:hypothetical protein CPB85DRAFT_1343454 [Mucidula mucida]|nr:hypothetical protein CPB85DRAFT_1343454 [Mucidula mucida]